MYIQDLSNVLTNIMLFIYNGALFTLLFKRYHLRPTEVMFYSLAIFLYIIMSFCGILFHINNEQFLLIQKYGTMLSAGLAAVCLAMAAIYDNYSLKTVRKLASFIILAFIIYFIMIVMEYRFIYFIVLQAIYFGLIMIAYLRQLPGKRSIYIYALVVSFVVAGGVQASSLRLPGLDHNDLFHLVLFFSIYCIYSAANTKKSQSEPAK